jgi:hypothetical protein
MVVLYAPWCPFCQKLEGDYETVAQQIGGESLRVAKYNADEDREYAQTVGLTTFPTIIFLPKGSEKVCRQLCCAGSRFHAKGVARWLRMWKYVFCACVSLYLLSEPASPHCHELVVHKTLQFACLFFCMML